MARYDPGRIAILKDYGNAVKEINPKAYLILEHFAENAEEIDLYKNGFLLWGNLNYNFNEASMGYKSNDLNGALAEKEDGQKLFDLLYGEPR